MQSALVMPAQCPLSTPCGRSAERPLPVQIIPSRPFAHQADHMPVRIPADRQPEILVAEPGDEMRIAMKLHPRAGQVAVRGLDVVDLVVDDGAAAGLVWLRR